MSLTPEEIAAVLKIADKPKRATGGRRTKADLTLTRDSVTWFRLQHTFQFSCANPDCKDPRPHSDSGRNCTAAIPDPNNKANKLQICRFCFLEGFGLSE